MKKSYWLLTIILFIFSLSYGNNNKNKNQKTTRIQELLRFPQHVKQLKKIKIQNLDVQKKIYGKHERNYYLICKNKTKPSSKKAIFYVHGGAWILGKPENHLKFAEYLTEQGFVVILTAYRYIYQTDSKSMLKDIQTAYQQACQELKKENPDIESIIIGGASAGGHLASLLALSNQNSIYPIIGLFSLSGVLDLAEFKNNLITRKLTQHFPMKLLNPIEYLHQSQKSFSILCIHGTQDGLVPVCSTLNFVEKAQENSCHSVQSYYFDLNHIQITSAWYYDSSVNLGQKELLLSWLLSL